MWVSVCGVCVGHRGGGLVCGPWDSQEDGGCDFYFCWFCLGFLIGVLLVSVEQGTFGVVLCVGRVAGLQGWVAEKSCHSQTLINECSVFDWLSGFGGLWLVPHAVLFQAVFLFCVPLELCFYFWLGIGSGQGWWRSHFSSPWGSQWSRIGLFLLCFTCPSPAGWFLYLCVDWFVSGVVGGGSLGAFNFLDDFNILHEFI